jgi:hypothetical protein
MQGVDIFDMKPLDASRKGTSSSQAVFFRVPSSVLSSRTAC